MRKLSWIVLVLMLTVAVVAVAMWFPPLRIWVTYLIVKLDPLEAFKTASEAGMKAAEFVLETKDRH